MNEFSDILIKIQKSEYLGREDIKFAYITDGIIDCSRAAG